MKKNLFILLPTLLTGCMLNTQTVVMPDGSSYSAELDSGAVATIKRPDGTEVSFDRRGKRSVLEDLIALYGIKTIGDE